MIETDLKIAVIGAGKIGLPIACQFASRGAHVTACDSSEEAVKSINSGLAPFDEPGLDDLLSACVKNGTLKATATTIQAVAECQIVVVIVPVLITDDREAETASIESVCREIAAGMKPGMMVCLETTVPVGYTRKLASILEGNGLKAGVDFDLVFSPERVKSRLVLERLEQTPKIVGGITPSAAARAATFYQCYLGAQVINVGTLEAAELVKLAGMVYRDVNIALSNELAGYAERYAIDYLSVIAAANTDNETNLLLPGIGVGGHCMPVCPHFLIQDAQKKNVPAALAETARRINDLQPGLVLDRVEKAWQALRGKDVLILGLGFRPNVKESLNSTAFKLRDELLVRGAQISLHDPLYSVAEIRNHGFEPCDIGQAKLPEVLILNTAHDSYAQLDFKTLAASGVKLILDGRNLWQAELVRQTGISYLSIGR